jgi:hypothetical protein
VLTLRAVAVVAHMVVKARATKGVAAGYSDWILEKMFTV